MTSEVSSKNKIHRLSSLLVFSAGQKLKLWNISFWWIRPLPLVPDLEISEKSVEQAADVIRAWVNHALALAHEIAICGNLRILLQVLWFLVFYTWLLCLVFVEDLSSHICYEFFVQVAALLWFISSIGSLCNFITFVYIGELTVFCLMLPCFHYFCPVANCLRV